MIKLIFSALASVLTLLIFSSLQGCRLPLTAASRAVPSGSVLFQDDFSNSSSGWLTGQDTNSSPAYYNNGFQIVVNAAELAKVSVPNLAFSDVRVEVDAAKTKGPDDNFYGLICRYQDEAHFYFFVISSDGYYGIGKHAGEAWHLIDIEQMQSTDSIKEGGAANHLRADCVGSSLTFYINGQQVQQANDEDYSSGDAGLIAGTLSQPGTVVYFDNFTVIKPK